MLGIKKQHAPSVRSQIGAGVLITGQCTFAGALQLDGALVGDLTADPDTPSTLVIGEGGRVEGTVSADHIVVAGQVLGPVQARERLELLASARIQGDVRYKTLEMQPGAVVAGQLQPQLTPPPAPAAALAPQVELSEPTLDPIEPKSE